MEHDAVEGHELHAGAVTWAVTLLPLPLGALIEQPNSYV